MNPATPPPSASAPPLRILHVVPAYYPAVRYGGPIRSVHGLAAALVRRGHEVHVYTTNIDGESDLDVPLDRPVELDGVQVHYFPVPALRRLCWSPAMSSKLSQCVREFDVVHVHSVFQWPTRAAARAAAAHGVPYILAPRGMLVRDLIRRKSRFIKRLWIDTVERHSLTRAAAVHVTSDLEGDELRAQFGALPEIANILNGVVFPREYPPRSATPFAELPPRYGLFLSRISWKKGLDRLITAWREVPDIPLVIAGNDDENYRPKLEELARAQGIAERVQFIGPVSDAHKWSLYADATLFVLPSYSENFGNVVAEAMAMGCPVVVSEEVGIAALVRQAQAGIVTRCDPADLAAAVRTLLADPARRSELGRRGRLAAEASLSWEGVAAQAEDLYRRVIPRAKVSARANRWRSVLRSSALVLGGYVAVAVVGMLALRLYTELAPAEVFGQANLLLTALTLGLQIFVAPVTNTQLRYHTEAAAEGKANAFTREAGVWALRSAAVLAILASIACLLCGRLGGPTLSVTIALAVAGWVFAMAARNVLLSRLQAERRRLAYSALSVFEAVMLALLTAVALRIEASTASYLFGQVLAILALVIAAARLGPWPGVSRGAGIEAHTDFRQKALAYGVPFAPVAIVGWLANLADRYVLGLQLGAGAVGQYVAPLSIASRGMILANSALNDLFRPVLFDAENRRRAASAHKVFLSWIGVNIAVGMTAVTMVWAAGDFVVELLLAKGYRDGATSVMMWIASGYAVYGLTQVFETRLLSLGRSAQLVAPMACGALANIGLSELLVPRHGILGAAQASCLSFVVQGLVTALIVYSALRVRRLPAGEVV